MGCASHTLSAHEGHSWQAAFCCADGGRSAITGPRHWENSGGAHIALGC